MDDFRSVLQAIHSKSTPTHVFFRDDDGGWASERLRVLADRFCAFKIPLNVAVIPDAVDAVSRPRLTELCRRGRGLVRFHQHGYAHESHQRAGRKSEFGGDRSAAAQLEDISAGRQALCAAFGDAVDPIFTPPWNRCTQPTVEALNRLGFEVLSRIAGSEKLETRNLVELPVAIDWQKRRNGRRLSREEFCAYAADCFSRRDVVGVMLHHGVMDLEELERFYKFIVTLRESGRIVFGSMMQLAQRAQGAGGGHD